MEFLCNRSFCVITDENVSYTRVSTYLIFVAYNLILSFFFYTTYLIILI